MRLLSRIFISWTPRRKFYHSSSIQSPAPIFNEAGVLTMEDITMSVRSSLTALLVFGGVMSFSVPSFALPMPQPTNTHDAGSLAEQVGWRCGPGWHMNRYGRCVPNRARARCARGWHLNRNGVCVRNRPVHKVCARGYHLTPRGYCVRNW